MDTEETILYQQLLDLPEEEETQFEQSLMNIRPTDAGAAPASHRGEDLSLTRFEELLDRIMSAEPSRSPQSEKAAFAAFCVRVTYLRRNRNYTREMDLLNRYQYRFQNHALFNHFYLMGLIDTDLISRSKEILARAKQDADRFRDNPGIQHLLVIAVVDIFERTEFTPEKQPPREWIDHASTAADRMLHINGAYAKYHSTMGRLLALRGFYDDALKEVHTAIDLEDSGKPGYALRIDGYQSFIQYIITKQRSEELEHRVQAELEQAGTLIKSMEQAQTEFQEKTRQALNRNTEFLGLFAGIVSFTIGGLDLVGAVGSYSFQAAAGLIVVLLGSLLCAFVGLDYILHAGEKRIHRANLTVLIVGALFILIGVGLCL